MEFTYQSHDWKREVKTISSESLVHAPSGLDDQQYQFTDLYNEGLNGILTEQATGWYYKHNLGNGKFEQAKLVSPKPSFAGLGSVMQLADLDADGGKQLVSFSNEPSGFFELDDENEWQTFRSFKALPNIDFGDSNTRMLDLNGDGKPEVVISEDNVFTWYPSEGREGFSQAHKTVKPFDEEAGPAVVFADQKQTIFLADMSGSGMSDIVRIRNGEVCYWPNLGYGKFGAKVAMDNAPVFDYPDAFNPDYIRLTDIDGSGTTDIVYLGKNKFTCWKNLSGNRFGTTPFEIDPFPEIHSQAKITVTDLLGNGVACIVWSSPLAKDSNAPLKYIDLMNSKKPHIMVSYKNNLGKEVSLEYLPSTKFYLEDKKAGKPWVTKLHFPVHCISKTITEDKISGYKFISEYKYHHGYYDHPEREFRGFGMVEQTDAETFEHWIKVDATNITEEPLHQEPVVSKSWHHTGAFLGKERILNQFKDDYWYAEMGRQGFPVVHHEVELPDARLITAPGLNPTLLDHLSGQEWQEALRACKGMGLRSEVFALDAIKYGNTTEAKQKELTPFSVATHNCMIEMLQPKGKNKHAVFVVKESEAISYSYERNPEDPRIAHSLNIKLDEFGNVLESASVVYPRINPDLSLSADIQNEQNKTTIIYTQNQFTNDVISADVYRLRLPSEAKTFELKGVEKENTFYRPADFENILTDEISDTALYHEIDKPTIAGKAQKRLIEHVRSIYYSNNLSDALPLQQMESLAFPYESYQLAFTPELIANIYGSKVNDETFITGKFTHSEGDNNWWIRSGTTQLIRDTETPTTALNRFYAPISYTDPYGTISKVKYYGDYFMFIEETEDALENISKVENIDPTKPGFNFRTLSAEWMKDLNGNYSTAIADELGLVKAVAIMGKGKQADELAGLTEHTDADELALIEDFFTALDSVQLTAFGKNLLLHVTARFVYDLEAYINHGKPAVVAAITRETHFRNPDESLNPDSKVQIGFEYFNGIGEVVMKKVQAEPGKAKQVIVNADNTIVINEIDTSATVPKQLRWIGNGRTIKNNKGNSVKQYEPYFSLSHHYEDFKELVETGVTPIIYYDAVGRNIKTEIPDGTYSKVEFDSWKQMMYDANDTVLDSPWYLNRINGLIDAELEQENRDPEKEKNAAEKSVIHANTPATIHLDLLGRPFCSIAHNKRQDFSTIVFTTIEEFYTTTGVVDTEGNLRAVIDAAGNTVMQYKYDMLGNQLYQLSMDAGERWMLNDCMGKPLRAWDAKDQQFTTAYDILHRPLSSSLIKDGNTIVTGKQNYCNTNELSDAELEQKQALNLVGQSLTQYDSAGITELKKADFKGNALETSWQLCKDYKAIPDWINPASIEMEAEIFSSSADFDALNRPIRSLTPHTDIIPPSVILPIYNESGMLNGVDAQIRGANANTHFVTDINHDAKGQRETIYYGNNSQTRYSYDKNNFRLIRLLTSANTGSTILQDLRYTYDAVGNITHIQDFSQPTVFYAGQEVVAKNEYDYDATSQLIRATGREHIGQNKQNETISNNNTRNFPFENGPTASDVTALRNYTQQYLYDGVGNILQMQHIANGASWTRKYWYNSNDAHRNELNIDAATIKNNQLLQTQMGTATPTRYTHDLQGNMLNLPHLQNMVWNYKDQFQQVGLLGGGNAFYVYDGSGQRIRKVIERIGGTKEERLYLGLVEIYRETNSAGTISKQTDSLHIMDDSSRIAMVDIPVITDDFEEAQVIRFIYSNHLGSSSLELNELAVTISYEEYHPFGTTSYQTKNKNIKAAAKRYRYTGMERDEETGLAYHSARYYLPWLGRWLSSDPIGIEGGMNLFCYCNNSSVLMRDSSGNGCDIIDEDFEAGLCHGDSDYQDESANVIYDDYDSQPVFGPQPPAGHFPQPPPPEQQVSDMDAIDPLILDNEGHICNDRYCLSEYDYFVEDNNTIVPLSNSGFEFEYNPTDVAIYPEVFQFNFLGYNDEGFAREFEPKIEVGVNAQIKIQEKAFPSWLGKLYWKPPGAALNAELSPEGLELKLGINYLSTVFETNEYCYLDTLCFGAEVEVGAKLELGGVIGAGKAGVKLPLVSAKIMADVKSAPVLDKVSWTFSGAMYEIYRELMPK
ncbi:MAG: toxin TcdB middle/N-terminal domain-containing protein [Bacteroidota bacterium]|nr:toxin TcdB middle/N-terminal domain-containing protein [Bacteroidota bacterium]